MPIKTKDKSHLYLDVYDKILKLINEGVYPVGSKLPAELELSKMMNVSRMTLRQALSLLQEDGYIVTIHGQGNFIKDNTKLRSVGLEKILIVVRKLLMALIPTFALNLSTIMII